MAEEPSRRASVSAMTAPDVANIKVFCRLRQQNQLERREGASPCSTVLDGRTMFLRDGKCDVDEIRCTFDRVFDTNSTQQEVYEHTAKSIVHDFLQGYNCTIFAYGQTGSGKTHTILGPKDGVLGKPEDEGIISRLVRDLYKSIEATTTASKDTKIELTASFVEIYMEQIRDLVSGTPMPVGGLKIRENAQRGVYIEDVTQVNCLSEDKMLDVVKTGTLNRAVSSTRMNKDSSRSHCILMVGATRKELRGTVVKKSMMYVVDLAGSEFVNKTNASGKVLQEAKAINKSLSALSNVIKALVEGKKHVPYRDSKLTRLLQDSLGGTAKTSLILAASCSSYNMAETISTLRFGLRAKEIKNPVVLKNSEATVAGGGIFKELYQQAMEDMDEKNKKIDELQQLLAQAYEASAAVDAESDEEIETLGIVADSTGDIAISDDEPIAATDQQVHGTLESQAHAIVDLEQWNLQLREENSRLFNVLESLDSQLEQITVKTTPNGKPFLALAPKTPSDNAASDHPVTLKMWMQSESWRKLTELDNVDLEEPLIAVGDTVPSEMTSGSTLSTGSPVVCVEGGEPSPHCVHRVDAEAMSRLVVELKLQLHYLTESTKQSLDGEQYIIVLENAKLKTRIEELEFQANLSNVRCNQLEMKNRAWETRLSNQDTHIACLQNSLQEYQGLFKQQIIMSQEKCRLLSDELEFYKKLSKHGVALDGGDHAGASPPSPSRSLSLSKLPSPKKIVGLRSPSTPRTSTSSSSSPFSRLKSLGSFYKPLVVDEEAPTTSLTLRAQRMIMKPSESTSPNQTQPADAKSPWRRKVFDLSFMSKDTIALVTDSNSTEKPAVVRTASSPELRSRMLLEGLLFKSYDTA